VFITYQAAKGKLYWYTEQADEHKLMAICTLLDDEIETGMLCNEATLNEPEKRRADMHSGKAKTYTLNETIDHLKQFRDKHGI
jgi:hypothetical protein